jgi:adenosine deaminase
LKDPIVDQQPQVLKKLLEFTLNNYKNAGVGYVEYSFSVGEFSNDKIKMKKRDQLKFNNVEHPIFKFLAAVNRGRIFLPYVDENEKIIKYAGIDKINLTSNECLSTFCLHFQEIYTSIKTEQNFIDDFKNVNDLSELCKNGKIFKYLKFMANYLCDDKQLEKIFDGYFVEKNFKEKFEVLLKDEDVVGFDLVGDETGFPYSPFSHDKFIDLIEKFQTTDDGKRKKNKKFGVRLHAGEGPIRPAKGSLLSSPLRIAFMLHMYVLMQSIRNLHAKLKAKDLIPNIRIGHGIAFLHGYQRFHAATCAPLSETFAPSEFHIDIAEFRDFLRRNEVVCELCPTSNFVLLSDSFDGDNLSNRSTLKAFLREKLSVVLCTDDEGIIDLGDCPCCNNFEKINLSDEEYREMFERSKADQNIIELYGEKLNAKNGDDKNEVHKSVKHEYCMSIKNGDIQDIKELKKMFTLSIEKSFFDVDYFLKENTYKFATEQKENFDDGKTVNDAVAF